jgi:hypothetical protein
MISGLDFTWRCLSPAIADSSWKNYGVNGKIDKNQIFINDKPIILRYAVNIPWAWTQDTVLGYCRIGIPVYAQTWLPLPYLHEGKVAYEQPYSDKRFIDFITQNVTALAKAIDGDTRLLAVEFGLIGQWGEFTTYLYNRYVNSTKPLYGLDEFRAIMEPTKLFKKTPILFRMLGPTPDKTAPNCGHEFTLNSFDDVFGHENSATHQKQIDTYGAKGAFNGCEVYPPLQKEVLSDSRWPSFLKEIERRKPCYIRFEAYKPQTQNEKDRYNTLRNIAAQNWKERIGKAVPHE